MLMKTEVKRVVINTSKQIRKRRSKLKSSNISHTHSLPDDTRENTRTPNTKELDKLRQQLYQLSVPLHGNLRVFPLPLTGSGARTFMTSHYKLLYSSARIPK